MFGGFGRWEALDQSSQLDEGATFIIQRPEEQIDESIRRVDRIPCGRRRNALHLSQQIRGATGSLRIPGVQFSGRMRAWISLGLAAMISSNITSASFTRPCITSACCREYCST
jgi:hypothetical protein